MTSNPQENEPPPCTCASFLTVRGKHKKDCPAEIPVMQFTGLKDKNMLQEVYEGDIIDGNGKIKGNIYEMDKREADLVIEGLGTSAWSKTEKEGLARGLKYAQ